MMTSVLRKILVGSVSAVLVAMAAGCSAPELADNGPEPSAPTQPPPPPPQPRYESVPPSDTADTTELLGGPADQDAEGPPPVVASTPVPNPEDLSPEDRARIYGEPHRPRYAAHTPRHAHGRRAHLRRHQGQAAHARHPAAASSLYKPLPHASVRHAPSAHAAPPPQATKPPAAVQPQVQPTPGAKLQRLGAALNAEVVSGSKLNVPAGVLAGKPGVVSLTMPKTLFKELTTAAAKLGLSHAAKTADASAILSGEGYMVTPDGVQTARLAFDEAVTFNWQVRPGTSPKGPLTADIGADLKGLGKPQSFTIGEVIGPSGPPPVDAGGQAAPNGGSVVDKLAVPGSPVVTVPGLGAVKSGLLVLLFVGLLIAVLGIALFNRARSERRAAERKRRERLREEHEERERATASAEAEPTDHQSA